MVLLEAHPGIGKSFFCLKLAQDWANGAMPSTLPIFELVLLLKCKDIEGHIMDAISEQLLPGSLEDKMKDYFLKFIGDVSNQERILVILDGWNELPEKSKHHVDNVLARRVLKFCYVMVTTRERPELRKRFKFNICLRMKGLSEVDSFDYIRKHFKNIGTEQSSKGESLIQEIKGNRLLQDLRSNRPNLFLLCLLCEDHEGELPSYSSDLYQTLLRCLLRRYCAKQKLKTNEEDMDLAKQFEREILAIGELALKCLLNFRHSFREDDLKLERSDEKSIALGLGFVYKEESLQRSEPHHVFTFVHKTFQEYLAASYIAHNLRGSKFYDLVPKQFIFGQWYRKFFLFLCGILREEASVLFTQVGDTLQKDWDWSKCSRVAASFFTEIWKESGNAERMANTLCSFLPFPRVLHVNEYHHKELINVLEACAGFSEVDTPAEVHVAVPPGLQGMKNIRRVLAGVPNVKTLTLPAVSYSIESAEVGEVLRASKTLEKVTFALSAGRGGGWASAFDIGLSAYSSLSSVGLRIYGILNQSALRAVENLLSNKCLSSISITIYGDVQESLAKVLARGLVGKSAVKFLDLSVNGKLSFDGAYSLQKVILRNGSLRNVKVSVDGELPLNWQGVGEKLYAELAKKGVVSSIYPNTFCKVKDSQ
ncbi:NACHT, LRR and PYD domains-containing protein 12-like, partial [Acropora millepora]|uniref:NACHT, LRR and PYD domains-containing protein 12-like n=1 Tax=Acropora millepora TaxID=45264 RepID=UPI001CF387A4